MTRAFTWLVFFTAAATTLASQRSSYPDTLGVVVTYGLAKKNLSPDRASLRINIATQDSTASAAAAKNSVRLRHVVDSLTAARLPAESVQVLSVSVRPRENFERGEVTAYEASAVVRVSLQTVDRVGAITDIALRSGATGVNEIRFHSDREKAARSEVLAEAYHQAYSDALALAKAAGMQLGPLLRLSTDVDPTKFLLSADFTFPGNGAATPQDVGVTAGVTATWRLRQSSP